MRYFFRYTQYPNQSDRKWARDRLLDGMRIAGLPGR